MAPAWPSWCTGWEPASTLRTGGRPAPGTDRIGRRESGHLTVLVKDGGDQVTFWSSNIPDGYGARTVPKSRIRRVIFTRITRPERFNLASSVGSHPWLSSLLRQEVGMKEVRRHSGMQNP